MKTLIESANRIQNWADVEGILENNIDTLDFAHIEKHLSPLSELKEDPEIMDKYYKLVKKIREALISLQYYYYKQIRRLRYTS